MARMGGEWSETFSLPVPPERAIAHLTDLAALAAATALVEDAAIQPPDRIAFTLKGQGFGGYSFQPRYTVAWSVQGNTVSWRTLEGNLHNEGAAVVTAEGSGSRVAWRQAISFDAPGGMLAAKVLAPVVQQAVTPGLQRYVAAVRASCPKA